MKIYEALRRDAISEIYIKIEFLVSALNFSWNVNLSLKVILDVLCIDEQNIASKIYVEVQPFHVFNRLSLILVYRIRIHHYWLAQVNFVVYSFKHTKKGVLYNQ